MEVSANNENMLQGKRFISSPESKGDTLINIDAASTYGDAYSIWNNVIKYLSPLTGTSIQRRYKRMAYAVLVIFLIVIMLAIFRTRTNTHDGIKLSPMDLSVPSWCVDNDRTEFPLTAIADRDQFSFKENLWTSVLLKGMLKRDKSTGQYTVKWDERNIDLKGKLAEQKRGLELSELKRFNGKLYTFDDRTGIVYEIMPDNAVIGRHILPDGDGNSPKGFKCEWATVKDNKLWVGSIGKEWTNDGKIIGKDPMWVKTIDAYGNVEHVNFIKNYEALRAAVGATYPGYLIHEAAEWSDFHKKWFFLPRRVSSLSYDEAEDVKRGSNIILIASEDFEHITVKRIGTVTPTRGFSTVKFIPGRPNEIVAIKSEEMGGTMRSYLTVFSLDGQMLMPETHIIDEKVEGLEIS